MEDPNKKEYMELMEQLQKVVSTFIHKQVTKPSLETIEKDFNVQDGLASLLLSVQIVTQLILEKGTDIDKPYLSSLPLEEIKKRIEVLGKYIEDNDPITPNSDTGKVVQEYLVTGSSQKHLLAYFEREMKWIVISILSASYVSSLVLMRSLFELLIGIGSKATGKMKDRLSSISFLADDENKYLLKLWYYLCGWGHPYGRWVKEVCPGYVSHEPIYHPDLCSTCFETLKKIIDLFIVVSIEKYEIPRESLIPKLSKSNISLKDFKLTSTRLMG